MRILFITNFFPPTHIGGTEQYTCGIARQFAKAGHQVRVACAGEWQLGLRWYNGYSDEAYDQIEVRRFHLNWTRAPDPNRSLYENPLIAEHIKHLVNMFCPDIVHVTSCYTLSATVIPAVKGLGIPVVLTLTDFWFLCPRLTLLRSDGKLCNGRTTEIECLECMGRESGLFQRLLRTVPSSLLRCFFYWASRHPNISRLRGLRGYLLDISSRRAYVAHALSQADYLMAPSRFVANVFAEAGSRCTIHVLPHGHDLSWLNNQHRRVPSPELHVGYIGQLNPVKGVHVLIEAFKKLDNSRMHLLIFGPLNSNSSYAKRLQGLAGEDGRIHFLGAFTRNDLGKVLQRIDVLVVPSLCYETYGMVIQEAFAVQVPVIASDLGAMSEYIQDGVSGLLFEPGSADDLARQLRRVSGDPGLLEQLKRGIPPVKSVEQEVEELLRIYVEVINRRPL